MQRNSTSTIVRRLGLTLLVIVSVHVIARLVWMWQWFGLNEGSEGYYNMWVGEEVEEILPTSFFGYTSDFWLIAGTHFIGLVITAILFGLVAWIFFSSVDDSQKRGR